MSDRFDLSIEWDVVIIGSGIGGATVAHSMARQGLKVLILEKGRKVSSELDQNEYTTAEERMARGWWPTPMSQKKADGTLVRFFAPIGCAVGGSSIHYAAALERMEKSDFEPFSASSNSAAAWPISFADFVPHYEAAERLYRVSTSQNPAAVDRLSEWDKAMMANMRLNGLRPEQLHVAINYDEQCSECTGRICPRSCKADARSACIEGALTNPTCVLLENCEVERLEADLSRVHAVHAHYGGKRLRITGRTFVLCAGAFQSPVLLLKSANEAWPQGLANRSGLVGRNLMFHTTEALAVWAPRKLNREGRQKKAISIKDFYVRNGVRLGYVQSLGIELGRAAIAIYLKNLLRQMGIQNELLLSALVKIPSHVAEMLLGSASVFAAMAEDDADADNRIVLDMKEPGGAHFSYTITDDLRARATALRKAFKEGIKPWRLVPLSPTFSMNYGHPCGTCRFGDNPETSVLDRYCKAHGLINLFVVDASFMPRSGAVNPSLTIAANALRVAPTIAAQSRS